MIFTEFICMAYIIIAFIFFVNAFRSLLTNEMLNKYSGFNTRLIVVVTIIFVSIFWIVFVIYEMYRKEEKVK